MVEIRALVVDDTPRMIDDMRSRLGHEFGKHDLAVTWKTAGRVAEGQELIKSEPRPFDVVIADLMFPRDDVPELEEERGLDLITEARQRSERTFILAISTGRDHLPDLMEEARNRGADHVLRRSEFSRSSSVHSPEAIATQIRTYLQNNGSVPVCAVTADPRDPAVQGLLHQVGEPTIARLHSEILLAGERRASAIQISFLTPGASGASVCKIIAQVDGVGRLSHILKLSRARDLLAREAERGKSAADVLPTHLLVHHRPQYPVGPVNGWYALGGPLVERANTLRAWLAGGPGETAVKNLLEDLFVEGLGHVYREGRREETEPLASFSFPPHRQQFVLQALGELKAVLTRPDGGRLDATEAERIVRDLTTFVTEGRLPQVPERSIPRDTYICYQHGDLHGGNVLVSRDLHPLPQLIDPSHFGRAHWATDPAWLAVDLLMRGVDAGAESMLFTGFATWRELASRFGAGRGDLAAVTADPATLAALAALSWLAGNLPRLFPSLHLGEPDGEHDWEWHVALGTRLLRCSYHSDIPHAKRAAALAAAYDQLTAAATIMNG